MHVHVQNEWFLIKFKEIRLKTGWKREGGLPCAHGPVRRVTTKHHKLHKQVMCCFYPNTLFYTLNTFFFCWDPWAKEVSLQTILCEMLLTCIYCDWLSTLIIGISVPTGGFQFLCSQAFSKCWQRPRKHYLLRGLLLELLVHVTHTKRERERESIFSYSNIDKLTVERQEMERQCFPPVLQHCTWIVDGTHTPVKLYPSRNEEIKHYYSFKFKKITCTQHPGIFSIVLSVLSHRQRPQIEAQKGNAARTSNDPKRVDEALSGPEGPEWWEQWVLQSHQNRDAGKVRFTSSLASLCCFNQCAIIVWWWGVWEGGWWSCVVVLDVVFLVPCWSGAQTFRTFGHWQRWLRSSSPLRLVLRVVGNGVPGKHPLPLIRGSRCLLTCCAKLVWSFFGCHCLSSPTWCCLCFVGRAFLMVVVLSPLVVGGCYVSSRTKELGRRQNVRARILCCKRVGHFGFCCCEHLQQTHSLHNDQVCVPPSGEASSKGTLLTWLNITSTLPGALGRFLSLFIHVYHITGNFTIPDSVCTPQ